MEKKLIVLSLDALQSNDLQVLKTLPHFSKFYEKASIVKNVREVYPTLTYPIHTTMITGVHPHEHGIYHNQIPGLERAMPDWSIMGSDWFWYKDAIKVETLVDAVAKKGGKVATLNWPVTGGDKRGINIPEIWPVKVKGENPREVYGRASSPAAFQEYYDSFISRYNWKDNNDLRAYSVDMAVDIIRNHKPDLFLYHVVHLDHARHVWGEEGSKIEDCLKELDIIVGRIIQSTVDAGTYHNTNFVLLGDHGQIEIENVFNLNKILAEKGLIKLDENLKTKDYVAYSFSAGFSTQIIMKEPENVSAYKKVYKILRELKKQYPQYIDAVYTDMEILEKENLSGEFSFVVEGTKGTMFYNRVDLPLIIKKGTEEFNFYEATHGHNPEKGVKPPFLAFGPDVKEKIRIEKGDMISVCPTLAKLAGVHMKAMKGESFSILK